MRWFSVTITLLSTIAIAAAQCALCKAAVQSSGNEGLAQGLRWGIGVLLVMPYLVVGTIAFAIYRAYRAQAKWHWQTGNN